MKFDRSRSPKIYLNVNTAKERAPFSSDLTYGGEIAVLIFQQNVFNLYFTLLFAFGHRVFLIGAVTFL